MTHAGLKSKSVYMVFHFVLFFNIKNISSTYSGVDRLGIDHRLTSFFRRIFPGGVSILFRYSMQQLALPGFTIRSAVSEGHLEGVTIDNDTLRLKLA